MPLNEFTTPSPSNQLFWDVMALEKDGKTDFALWAPGRVAHFDLEQRVDQSRDVVLARDIISKPYFGKGFDELSQDECKRWLKEIDDDWSDALASRDIRTLIMDNGTTYANTVTIALLARKGLPEEVGYKYGIVNRHIEGLVRDARASDKIIIWTHRLKPRYVKAPGDKRGEWDGTYIRDGYKHAGNIFDIGLSIKLDDEDRVYKATILYTTRNAMIWKGEVIDLPEEGSFAYVAALLTDTSEEEWQ